MYIIFQALLMHACRITLKILAGALVSTVPGYKNHDKASISLGYM